MDEVKDEGCKVGGAPDRFLKEATPELLRYAERSQAEELDVIKRAQKIRLTQSKAAGKDADYSEIMNWVAKETKLPVGVVKAAEKQAKMEEGKCDTIWDMTQGLTAVARQHTHTDTRVDVERKAAKLLKVA